MTKSSPGDPLGIVRSTAVISLGLVALAGSIAASLCRRIVSVPLGLDTSKTKISRLVMDEWETELSRLPLPSRREVEDMQPSHSAEARSINSCSTPHWQKQECLSGDMP
jgi:hypothetical protein